MIRNVFFQLAQNVISINSRPEQKELWFPWPGVVGTQNMDFDSTLIRRAKHVSTFKDVAEFRDTLEQRPIVKLLGELPALAKISQTQFILATTVIRRRYEEQPTAEQFELQSVGLEIAADVLDADTSAKIRSVFNPAADEQTWRRRESN